MRRRITDALVENDRRPTPLAPVELANLLGVPPERIHEAQSRLRSRRQVRPSERQFSRTAKPKRRAATPTTPALPLSAPTLGAQEPQREASLDVERLFTDLEQEVVLTDLDRRRILSRLGRHGPGPVRVAAIRELEMMDRQQGRQVGPPAPVGDDEHVARCVRILHGMGPELGERVISDVRESWRRDAFPQGVASRNTAAGREWWDGGGLPETLSGRS